jgi:transcription antitermination factor NusG
LFRTSKDGQEMTSEPWHVIQVRSNAEKRVAQHLAARSLEHFLPLYSEKARWTDRTVVTQRPLFVGYIFARFARHQRVTVISLPGIIRDFGDEDKNMVGDDEISRIRGGIENGLSLCPHRGLDLGAKVRVRGGIFAGSEGIVKEYRPHCRVILTLEAVRQSFSFESEWDNLELISRTGSFTPCSRPLGQSVRQARQLRSNLV